MHCYLGIDIGTTAVEAAAIGPDGSLIKSSEVMIETIRPRAGWSEQDPDAWVEAAHFCIAKIAEGLPGRLSKVLAIGFSGQMHGLIALGADNRPLRNAILWNDDRASAEAEYLNRAAPDLGAILGVPATPSFLAPKWMWLAKHEPEIAASTHKILFAKGYVRMMFTGDISTDVVDASGGWLLDQTTRSWSDRALDLCDLSADLLPKLCESATVVGTVSPSASARFSLPQGVPVVAGAGDAAAGCVGLRMVRPGQDFINLGTSAQIFITSDRHEQSPAEMIHSFSHALQGRWFRMAALLNGASALGWLARILSETPAKLASEAARVWSAETPLFLPYLSGERTPHNDPHARGVFFGLASASERADLAAATLDGVALALRDAFEALARSGSVSSVMGATGGGTRDKFWLSLIASSLNLPIEVYGGAASGAAVGAALLARAVSFPLDDLPPLRVSDRIEPNPEMSDILDERYSRFTKLYVTTVTDRANSVA
jgi:xylulokinase